MDVGYTEAIQKRGLWEMKNEWPSGQQFGSDPNSDSFLLDVALFLEYSVPG